MSCVCSSNFTNLYILLSGLNNISLLSIDANATTVLVFLLLFFIFLSFIVSGAEVAFFSLTFKDINYLKTKQENSYRRIVELLDDPKGLLASLLITNNFSNISIIIISNILFNNLLPTELQENNFWAEFLIKVLAVTALLVLVCEIVPKIYANQNNIRYARQTGVFVEGINLMFKGLGRGLVRYSDMIEKHLSEKVKGVYNKEQLEQAIDLTNTEKEKNILKGILKFGNTSVKQIMKTRMDVSGLEYDISFHELVRRIEELHYSRLPVYKDDLDQIAGIIHTKDVLPFLGMEDSFDWHTVMRPAFFVHEQKHIEDLLAEFQLKRIHFAVVVDEFGGTSGIVTLEDIMEEVIGDIRDEFDEEEGDYKKLEDHVFVFEGRTMINDALRFMDLPSDTFNSIRGDSDSMAGLVLEVTGEIPTVNTPVLSGDFEFTVLSVQKNRLEKIKVSFRPHPSA